MTRYLTIYNDPPFNAKGKIVYQKSSKLVDITLISRVILIYGDRVGGRAIDVRLTYLT